MKKCHEVRKPSVNRKYKDTVFRLLFSDKENLLSLYNAIAGTSYQNADRLKIVTLENAVYMGMKNDLAFLLDTGLYLYEHQSTWNPNMPLRDLFYIASEYQVLADQKSLYSSVLCRIPVPKFLVFYNGSEIREDILTLRLSDAFELPQTDPDLELKVTVYNINAGHNRSLMEQCKILSDYAAYVAKVRQYAERLSLTDAVEKAITECINEGILQEFLRKNRSEVLKVSIFEYDKEKEEKKLREAEFEAGEANGMLIGQARAIVSMGREFGLTDEEIAFRLRTTLKISDSEIRKYMN